MARDWQLTMYVRDAVPQAAFWCEVLGYVRQAPPDGFETWEDALRAFGFPEDRLSPDQAGAIVDPGGEGPRIFLHQVPEDKPDRMNRLHLDVRVSDPGDDEAARRAAQDAEVDRLVALGASVHRRIEDLGQTWVVVRDPEGNEFCVT